MADDRSFARRLIDTLMGSDRVRESSHFSERIASGEPILTTGRQMAGYLPDRYREMRAISRFQMGADGRGRWLPEAEHFYRQARFMADWEDDCPYTGTFKSYYPTYDAMSDRQLRGYFTWRTRVRAGEVEETSTSFAFVYLYELLSGVGVVSAEEGFWRLRGFWRAWQTISDDLDRHLPVWLIDYCVYHGLDPALIADLAPVAHERALAELIRATDEAVASLPPLSGRRGGAGVPPLGDELEERLFHAIDALSSYRVARSRLAAEHGRDLRHVACAIYLRLFEHYRSKRKLGLIESAFGQITELPYTMFASAMFFDPALHEDAVYEVSPLRRYRCAGGLWTCARMHGKAERSSEIGRAMRAADQRLRAALGFAHPLKEDEGLPKYLGKIIDAEVAAHLAWVEAHRPVELDIDLSRLSGIRSAAAETREALLIDEEREEGAPGAGDTEASGAGGAAAAPARPDALPEDTTADARVEGSAAVRYGENTDGAAREAACGADAESAGSTPPAPAATPAGAPAPPSADDGAGGPLPHPLAAYLRALLTGDAPGAAAALEGARLTEDLAVDAVNEALFDLIGDTALEFGADGPTPIEDYREDLERIVNDAD